MGSQLKSDSEHFNKSINKTERVANKTNISKVIQNVTNKAIKASKNKNSLKHQDVSKSSNDKIVDVRNKRKFPKHSITPDQNSKIIKKVKGQKIKKLSKISHSNLHSDNLIPSLNKSDTSNQINNIDKVANS